jgi:predicted component of type VI protein secretion system
VFELSVYLKDRLVGRSRFTGDEVRIGRSADNEVQIDNLGLSRYHASIEHLDGLFLLKDFGSANGTFVNGERVAGRRGLNDGDRIGVGKFTLVFHPDRVKTSTAVADVRDAAAYAIAGETIVTSPAAAKEAVERPCPFLAYLEATAIGPEGPRVWPLARDITIVGAATSCDVVAEGAPERAAAIVRGWRGFSVVVLGQGFLRNGKPVDVQAELRSKDELAVGRARWRFLVGRPDAGP